MLHKQLPANPSLEHLKSQAKRLLKAHKEGSPDAFQRIRSFFPKLSDATDVEIQSTAFGLKTLASETVSHTYEMSPLLVAIGTWYGVREAAEALDECLEIVVALLEAGPDLHRSYKVDIDGEVLELTPLAYTRKLASLFPDKPFDRIIEVLLGAGAV